MDFEVLQNGQVVSRVNREWFTLRVVTEIVNEEIEQLVWFKCFNCEFC